MNLKTTYMGKNDPFEGDLKIWMRSLPEGASVTGATVTLEPIKLHGKQEVFEETFVFAAELSNGDIKDGKLSAAAWGVLKNPTTPDFFVEVDFHARRRLAGVKGSGVNGGNKDPKLSVDLGGAYIAIADDGTFLVPDKKEWRVNLSLETKAPLPGLIVNRFMLTGTRADAEAETTVDELDITEVSIISVPTNVSLHLGNMPPFWIHTGDMVVAETSTDFADVLKAYLAGAQVEGGFYAVPLIVHSDSISRLNVTISIDYVIQQSVLPSHLPEATLPYGYSSLPGTDDALLTATLPRGALPLPGTGGKIKGTFDASRVVFGFIGESRTTDLVDIHPGRTLAQPILVDKEISASAIDLPLGNTETGLAGLNLALQNDADGKPSGTVLIIADISVERPIPGGPAWGSAKLPSKFRFLPGVRYWLTIQIITGSAYWETMRSNIGTVPLQSSSDGGISWNNAATQTGQGPLQATFRLRHIPTKFSVPVQLQIGKGPDAIRTCFDQFAPLGRVDFNVDFTSGLCDYLSESAGKSRCDTGDLITNGGFEMPQYDDATFKLFGFYNKTLEASETSGSDQKIIGNVNLDRGVDLSIQRFIQLAVDDSKPIRINCAGKVPSRTCPEEIVSAINKAMGKDVASYLGGSLKIKGSSSVRLLLWCSQQIYGWKVKSGSVVRIRGDLNDIYVVLIAPPTLISDPDQRLICLGSDKQSADQMQPTVLSQDISVSSGCNYLLSFQYGNSHPESNQKVISALFVSTSKVGIFGQPYWEVVWMDEKGLPIKTQSSKIDATNARVLLVKYEVRLTAPTNAVKASVRLIQPPTGILLVNDVSFKPTLDALDNGNFLQWMEEGNNYLSPSGWSHSGSIDPIDSSRSGVKLSGDGVEDAILTQTTEVIAGKRYTLKIKAWPNSPSNAGTQSIEKRARAELRWLTDGTAAGNPVILLLDGRDFPEHTWAADVPAGINQAEIRLIQPKSNNVLNVKSVSFEKLDIITVPLIFLSEAPGELTVSNLRLTYDFPTPSKLQ